MKVLDFYLDFISPYSYLAWTQIHTLAARYERQVRPVPILFAALLNHNQTRGPAEIPAKRVWVFKDTVRTARRLGVPFGPPPHHPFNPLLALRVAGLCEGEEQKRLIDALYAATWGGDGGGVEDPAEVVRVASSVGLDGEELVARAALLESKDKLRHATERALTLGVFGVPTMLVDGELFWGLDAFGHLEDFLAGRDTLRPEDAARWAAVTPSATRIP